MLTTSSRTGHQVRINLATDLGNASTNAAGAPVLGSVEEAPDTRFAGLPTSSTAAQPPAQGWASWFSALFPTASQVPDKKRLPLAALIKKIEHCRPDGAPALVAALQRRLGLRHERARWSPAEVMAKLRRPDWCGEVVSGRLDMASLLQAIGAMSDWNTQRALMAAVELATTRPAGGAAVATTAHDTAVHDAGHPAPGQDPLQARVVEVLGTPDGQGSLASITKLFRKVGDDVPVGSIALPLACHYNRLTADANMSPALRAAFMPRLVEIMLAGGYIDGEHTPLARAAAARVSQYASLSLPRKPFTRGLPHLANDQQLLCRLMNAPDEWSVVIGENLHHFGVMRREAFQTLLVNLLDCTESMEASGFIEAGTAELLRDRLPYMVEACYRKNRELHGLGVDQPVVHPDTQPSV